MFDPLFRHEFLFSITAIFKFYPLLNYSRQFDDEIFVYELQAAYHKNCNYSYCTLFISSTWFFSKPL